MNGEAKSYDENGKLNGRTIFKDDIKLEEDVYKENEILKNTFKNGELVKQDICTLNGTLKERRILNGDEMEYSTFYSNGNVKQKILAKDKIIIKEQHNCRATGFWKTNSVKYNFLLIAHEYLFVFKK